MSGSLPQSGEVGTAFCRSEEIHTCQLVAKGAAVKFPLDPPDDPDSCRIHVRILGKESRKVKLRVGQELRQSRVDSRQRSLPGSRGQTLHPVLPQRLLRQ